MADLHDRAHLLCARRVHDHERPFALLRKMRREVAAGVVIQVLRDGTNIVLPHDSNEICPCASIFDPEISCRGGLVAAIGVVEAVEEGVACRA